MRSRKKKKNREIKSLVTSLDNTLISRKNVDFSEKIVIAFYNSITLFHTVRNAIFCRRKFREMKRKKLYCVQNIDLTKKLRRRELLVVPHCDS